MSRVLVAVFFSAVIHAEPTGDMPQPPYTVEQLRHWHQGFGQAWPWTFSPEQAYTLRSEGPPQVMLCAGGGARSGSFVLFKQDASGWIPISDLIDQAHHPLHILDHAVAGWRDFKTFLPLWGSGGDEVMVVHYRWDGSQYEVLASSTGRWCDHEPFKQDRDLCSSD